jgi:hypothetical protein
VFGHALFRSPDGPRRNDYFPNGRIKNEYNHLIPEGYKKLWFSIERTAKHVNYGLFLDTWRWFLYDFRLATTIKALSRLKEVTNGRNRGYQHLFGTGP